ncbi:MAG: glycosyltransferase family 39 protein [Rhodospirillales bacterium]|nr:glycosyltransferase family 39 protein [Rhodospirillales bacterium]
MPSSVPEFRRSALPRGALPAMAVLTLARLAVAAFVPLSADEAYYWIWSRGLQGGYLDHPPMVALWIRIGTALAGATPLGVRLLGPLSAALGTVLLWRAGEALFPGRHAGLRAALLFNATLMAGVGTVIMTPDTPLMFFWIACLWALAEFSRARNGWWLVLAALAAGWGFDSKYTAAFLAVGALLWLLWVPALRRILATPTPYWGALFGTQAILPVIRWNQAHGWASFLRQGGRVVHWHPADAPRLLVELLLSQAGLATPLIFALGAAGLAVAARRAAREREAGATLLAAMSLPAIAVFVEHCLAGRVQGNWPAIVYPAAALAAGALAPPAWRKLRAPAVALGLAVTGAAYFQAMTGALPIPPARDPTALKLAGWGGLARRAARLGALEGTSYVAATDYAVAAELAWHLPGGAVGVERRWGYFALPAAPIAGRTGLLVRSLHRAGPPDPAPWQSVRALGTLWRRRDGARIEGYRLYRVIARAPGTVPAAVLPGR